MSSDDLTKLQTASAQLRKLNIWLKQRLAVNQSEDHPIPDAKGRGVVEQFEGALKFLQSIDREFFEGLGEPEGLLKVAAGTPTIECYCVKDLKRLQTAVNETLLVIQEHPLLQPPDQRLQRDDRRFMRKAIAEARKCKPEPRDDPPPCVGVVVVKNGEVLATSYRGELTAGDHAEFTAMEKKLKDAVLVGATVFTTLEPCTTRSHPKDPCAVHLARRKVARVVIGMVDPDDRVSGKGMRMLRKANIAVSMCDPDHASEIEEMNRKFIKSREGTGPQPEAGGPDQNYTINENRFAKWKLPYEEYNGQPIISGPRANAFAKAYPDRGRCLYGDELSHIYLDQWYEMTRRSDQDGYILTPSSALSVLDYTPGPKPVKEGPDLALILLPPASTNKGGRFPLVLKNEGNQTADNVEVEMRFPPALALNKGQGGGWHRSPSIENPKLSGIGSVNPGGKAPLGYITVRPGVVPSNVAGTHQIEWTITMRDAPSRSGHIDVQVRSP